ncbi:hypothetical protein YBT020_00855 [Bacillus thuringiensis serovar finitimus YBT-020]|nr:hypothetical protein YBT020_00855 [Bacillus thuringiensis serovar finitimus YBT-020]
MQGLHIWLVHPLCKDRYVCGEIHISYIKYASFKIGGVYDESIKT